MSPANLPPPPVTVEVEGSLFFGVEEIFSLPSENWNFYLFRGISLDNLGILRLHRPAREVAYLKEAPEESSITVFPS